MTITALDSDTLALRDTLSKKEQYVIDETFSAMQWAAKELSVKLAGDDREATLEAALIRFVIASRA